MQPGPGTEPRPRRRASGRRRRGSEPSPRLRPQAAQAARPGLPIWKPIPVRIFYTFVIYQGYDMDIPHANNLERHILVIYFLTFGQIF